MPASPRRVRIVGNSGAGKTTLARQAARRLGVPHLELDETFWGPHWVMRDLAEAQAAVLAFVASEEASGGWVMDGNWATRMAGVEVDPDVIVWLDFPRRVVMSRVIRRSVGRALTRREIWHGNRESLRNLFRRDTDANIVFFAWKAHEVHRVRYAALQATGDVPVKRLGSPREARAWLGSLA